MDSYEKEIHESRRNNVPAIVLPTGAVLTDFSRRYQVPLSEITSNPNERPCGAVYKSPFVKC